MPSMIPYSVALLLGYVLYRLTRTSRRSALEVLPGPPPGSFIMGNTTEFVSGEAGTIDREWRKKYGNVVRYKGPLGEDRLFLTDPRAIHHIYQSGYNVGKPLHHLEQVRLLTGKGLLWASGAAHNKQRTIVSPAFRAVEARSLVGTFTDCAAKVTVAWKAAIASSGGSGATVNVQRWLARAALDAIGLAAFDYDFHSVEDDSNALAAGYNNILHDIHGPASPIKHFVEGVANHIPIWVFETMSKYSTARPLKRAREIAAIGTAVAQDLIANRTIDMQNGIEKYDLLTILLKANMSEDPKNRITNEEITAQMSTMMIAGHETSSNTLGWALLELARNPSIQDRLREEIRAHLLAAKAEGRVYLEARELEKMSYLGAFLKEVLRCHSPGVRDLREVMCDEVLPLSSGVRTTSGEVITELPVQKGLQIVVSIAAYNYNEEIWGDDAAEFNPDRWLTDRRKTTLNAGFYNNLLTFGGGVRACVGWRFAITEMQAFLVELVDNFQFDLSDESSKIQKGTCLIMVPIVQDGGHEGISLPLKISEAARD